MGLKSWWRSQITISTQEQSCFTSSQESISVLMSESKVTWFFNWSIVHYEFIPPGQSGFYVMVLRRLRDVVQRKWSEMWTERSWLLHQNNPPAHTTLSIRQFLAKHSTSTIQQPYSLHLPSQFFVHKTTLKRRYQTGEHIANNATNDLKKIPNILRTVLPPVERVVGGVHCCARRDNIQ